jgi:hypothetical protein
VTSWSFVQRSTTDCGVSKKCVIVKPRRNEEAQAQIGLLSHRKKMFAGLQFLNAEFVPNHRRVDGTTVFGVPSLKNVIFVIHVSVQRRYRVSGVYYSRKSLLQQLDKV